jgi:hypothetical protein
MVLEAIYEEDFVGSAALPEHRGLSEPDMYRLDATLVFAVP